MEAVRAFDAHVRERLLPRISDDVFFALIVPAVTKECCTVCHAWIGGRDAYAACFLPCSTLCFSCRHRTRWPRPY